MCAMTNSLRHRALLQVCAAIYIPANTCAPKRLRPHRHGPYNIRMCIPAQPPHGSRRRVRPSHATVFSFHSSTDLHLTLRRLPNIIMCTSLLWRLDKLGEQALSWSGCMDGAKIYFCYWRSCFLTRKRRSSLLNRLSPRKSRFQSHPSEVRSVSQRRSRHHESVSARRSLRH